MSKSVFCVGESEDLSALTRVSGPSMALSICYLRKVCMRKRTRDFVGYASTTQKTIGV